jgi:hypothetical protein
MEPFVTGAIVTISYVVVVSLIGALKLIRHKEEGSQSTVHTKMHVWPTSSDYQEGGAARYRLEEPRDLESLQEDIRKMEEGLTKRKEAESGGPEAKRNLSLLDLLSAVTSPGSTVLGDDAVEPPNEDRSPTYKSSPCPRASALRSVYSLTYFFFKLTNCIAPPWLRTPRWTYWQRLIRVAPCLDRFLATLASCLSKTAEFEPCNTFNGLPLSSSSSSRSFKSRSYNLCSS